MKLPKPLDFWASNFHSIIDMNLCDGCGACEKRCQVGAVRVSEKKQVAHVNLNCCIGCGVCVDTCTKTAISVVKKPNEIRPPETREALYDMIMTKKKSRFGKLMVFGKLVVDAIRTGQIHLLK